MTRRGMTLVEVVVAAAIAFSALGLLMELWRTSDRLDRTAGSSASLAAAASLEPMMLQEKCDHLAPPRVQS